MSKDILIGFLLAVPLYAIIMFLFKDIIVGTFIKRLLQNSTVIDGPDNPVPFTTPEFKEAIEKDLLVSYKLLLIIKDEYKFLCAESRDRTLVELYEQKLEDLDFAIGCTEGVFDDMGSTEYKTIKRDVSKLLRDKTLF